jgi:DNA-binding MarR family transcriptional regulator
MYVNELVNGAPAQDGADQDAAQDFDQGVIKTYLLSRKLARSVADACETCGVGVRQYELLLTVFVLGGHGLPAVKEIARELHLRHNSTVELIDRSVARELVERKPDGGDRRQVRIALTPGGSEIIARVATMVRETAGAVMEQMSAALNQGSSELWPVEQDGPQIHKAAANGTR